MKYVDASPKPRRRRQGKDPEVEVCLACHLPTCKPKSKHCPLKRYIELNPRSEKNKG